MPPGVSSLRRTRSAPSAITPAWIISRADRASARDQAAALVGALLQDENLIVQTGEARLQVRQQAHGRDHLALPAERVDLPLRAAATSGWPSAGAAGRRGRPSPPARPAPARWPARNSRASGCSSQTSPSADGSQGASNRAVNAGPASVWRSWVRSRRPCPGSPVRAPGSQDARRQPRTQAGRQPRQHRGADALQHAQRRQCEAGDQDQGEQRVVAATAEHPIVDLQREHRHRQHQHADREADRSPASASGERAASITIRPGVEAGSARTSVSFPRRRRLH